jgi:hypothetical protein
MFSACGIALKSSKSRFTTKEFLTGDACLRVEGSHFQNLLLNVVSKKDATATAIVMTAATVAKRPESSVLRFKQVLLLFLSLLVAEHRGRLVSTPPSYLASTRIRCGPEDRFF